MFVVVVVVVAAALVVAVLLELVWNKTIIFSVPFSSKLIDEGGDPLHVCIA